MAVETDTSVHIDAPVDLVWDITNDVAAWPRLFSEYAAADILEQGPDYVQFRLTMHPDEQGIVWNWVSERSLDRDRRTVSARRVETGPFEYMNIHWSYHPRPEGGTTLRWAQDFKMKPGAPVDDVTMQQRITTNSAVQLQLIKAAVERAAHAPSVRNFVLRGLDGETVRLADRGGRPLVVLLGNRRTQTAGHRAVDQLRTDPATADVPILQVAHLKGVPRTLRSVATADIAAGRQQQVARSEHLRSLAGLPNEGEDEAIGLALDWTGELGAIYRFTGRDTIPLTMVADPYLCVINVLRSRDPLPGVRAALKSLSTARLADRFASGGGSS